MYLTVTETSDTTPPAKVFGGRYPTTWELNQGVEDHEMYIIKRAGCDRVIDLDDWGNAFNGNQISNSDDTGEEKQQLLKELQIKDEEIKGKNTRIKEQNIQLNEKTCQLADQENQLALLKAQLASRDEEPNEARLNLDRKSTLPAQTHDAVRGAGEWPETQGVELPRSQVQETNSRLDKELIRPTEKLKRLQEKFDNLERMFVQMTSQGIKLNNIAG
ncbi:hypothetical protein FRC12_006485 [Ceratobasidium sp. 428]|nr:hypothetical protein FRC12_006485 [Ceratobasidium sp. 428]